MENLPTGTVVGSLEVIAESGGDATTGFDFELTGIDGNPLSAGEGGPSPVNGITSLVFERSQWITLSDISLELPDGREPGKKILMAEAGIYLRSAPLDGYRSRRCNEGEGQ